jgi:hypothetical protein
MATDSLTSFLQKQTQGIGSFKPYHEFSKEADAITVRFKGDADFAKRLTDHVTIFLSMETKELVGCRIKGVSEIIKDLPNYIRVDDGDVQVSLFFLSLRGGAEDEEARTTFNTLGRATQDMVLPKKELAGGCS